MGWLAGGQCLSCPFRRVNLAWLLQPPPAAAWARLPTIGVRWHCISSPPSPCTDWIDQELAAGWPPCSPLTGAPLAELSLRPNLALRGIMGAFAAASLL